MIWDSIFNAIKAAGQVIGLVRDVKDAAATKQSEPVDAAAQRAGTAAGAAAYSAGKRAGKEK